MTPGLSPMNSSYPSLDLVEFIETQILPQYAQFDKAHNMEHVTRVIRRSLELVRTTGTDINMALEYMTSALKKRCTTFVVSRRSDTGSRRPTETLVHARTDKNHEGSR